MVIQRILCPVDFSDGARRALEHAAAIARRWHSALTVLHVYQAPSPLDLIGGLDNTIVTEPDLDMLRATLVEFARPIVGDLTVTFRLVHGVDAAHPIVNAAAADLLVVGSHGHSGLERLIVGSTGEKVVRKAPCPVIVVPPGAAPPRDGSFARILCGMDFSSPSLQAFRHAMHLASAGHAELTLLHAIEVPSELRERQLVAAVDVEAVRAAAKAAARHRLESIDPGDGAPPVRILTQVVEGPADRRLLEAARQWHADLIVLGMHGRNAIDRWVFGSHTRAVLRDAPCPVLTVRPE